MNNFGLGGGVFSLLPKKGYVKDTCLCLSVSYARARRHRKHTFLLGMYASSGSTTNPSRLALSGDHIIVSLPATRFSAFVLFLRFRYPASADSLRCCSTSRHRKTR